ncbi:MAG: hypothetical protein JXA25_13440 [Anaerolineales bacterium]|nr:hypothetical protein [Anaerolineales bacterium]
MASAGTSLCLTPDQTVILLSDLGADSLLGFSDPFRGFLVEEIHEKIDGEILPALDEMGVIRLNEQGMYRIDPAYQTLLQRAATPRLTVLFDETAAKETRAGLLHRDESGLAQQRLLDGEVVLEALQEQPLEESLLGRYLLKERGLPSGSELVLPQRIFKDAAARMLTGDPEGAHRVLAESGLEREDQQVLLDALAGYVRQVTLVGMKRSAVPWKVLGLAFLECETGYWEMKPLQGEVEDRVVLAPRSSAELRERLATWCDSLVL